MNKKVITTLYNKYKNTPKKLKIICDWDEVIQATEPYALWKYLRGDKEFKYEWQKEIGFEEFFHGTFWGRRDIYPPNDLRNEIKIEYSPYGSRLNFDEAGEGVREGQPKIKNSPDFYQQAPFLTIAEDLLRLIKEDKVERLIFLSAYDKRKFPNRDERKIEIFGETFGNPSKWAKIIGLQLIPFDSETQGQSKADWIKENASDFDIVIDDNPIICRSIVEMRKDDDADWDRRGDECMGCSDCWDPEVLFGNMTILAPYYPAIENQHHPEVILIKQEVSALRKEDFI